LGRQRCVNLATRDGKARKTSAGALPHTQTTFACVEVAHVYDQNGDSLSSLDGLARVVGRAGKQAGGRASYLVF